MIDATHLDFGRTTAPDCRELRTPEWAALVARFAAARELRSTLHRPLPRDAGRFACFASRTAERVKATADFVNQANLTDGKADGAKTVDQVTPAHGNGPTGDREL